MCWYCAPANSFRAKILSGWKLNYLAGGKLLITLADNVSKLRAFVKTQSYLLMHLLLPLSLVLAKAIVLTESSNFTKIIYRWKVYYGLQGWSSLFLFFYSFAYGLPWDSFYLAELSYIFIYQTTVTIDKSIASRTI